MSKRALLLIGFLFLVASCGSAEWGEPVNLGPNINRAVGSIEYYPTISADGTELFYTTGDRPGGYGDDDIWISAWQDTIWGAPVNAGPNVNWEWRDLSPSISSDGTKLYFVSWGRPGGYGSYDVWVSTWEDTMWGPAMSVGSNVNTAYIEWSVNIAFDGRRLYFASNRPGTFGDTDIWVSEWDSINGEWGPAANLGPNVNSFNSEYSPCVSRDGTTLHFARWLGINHPDIFVSEWQDTIWGPGVNLGPPVNTPTWDDGPSITSDGMKLYFASSRDTNNPAIQDIWVSEWIPEGVEEENRKSKIVNATLLAIQPNPFFSSALIRFSLPASESVSLRIYDISGRMVRVLVQEVMESSTYQVLWDGRNEEGEAVGSGIYFCRLNTGSLTQSLKIVLIR